MIITDDPPDQKEVELEMSQSQSGAALTPAAGNAGTPTQKEDYGVTEKRQGFGSGWTDAAANSKGRCSRLLSNA